MANYYVVVSYDTGVEKTLWTTSPDHAIDDHLNHWYDSISGELLYMGYRKMKDGTMIEGDRLASIYGYELDPEPFEVDLYPPNRISRIQVFRDDHPDYVGTEGMEAKHLG